MSGSVLRMVAAPNEAPMLTGGPVLRKQKTGVIFYLVESALVFPAQ